jgi:FkbM family methyltransferase
MNTKLILKKIGGVARRITFAKKKRRFAREPLYDIKKILPGYKIETVIDVGANIGQTAKSFLKAFPGAKIYCIEPVRDTYETLKKNLHSKRNVLCFNKAFGSHNGVAEFSFNTDASVSVMNSLRVENNLNDTSTIRREKVEIVTLDSFCAENKLNKINYLKIDTEGFDLEVLKGAKSMLENGKIDFIEAEAGMNPDNDYHVAFNEIKEYLEGLDYYLFGIYEQYQEWILKKPILRRSNPLFIYKPFANKLGRK